MAARAHTNLTTVNLASSTAKKVQSTDEILKQIESTLPDASQQNMAQRQGGLSARLQGRINEHALTYGDKSLPRQRLPKVGNVLLDRYQAARHNVLVLGAIQLIEAKTKSNTHRSGKSGSHTPHNGSHTPARPASRAGASSIGGSRFSDAGDTEGQDESSWEAGGLSAGPTGLYSDFDSFKSRVSSKALGSIQEDPLSAQPSGPNLNPEASQVSSKAGRRFNRQGSNSSMASRVSAVSYASGLMGVSRASSTGRHMRQQPSYISSGGSSGHTLRSHRTGSVAGSSWGGHHKKGGKRKPSQPEPGRVTRAFAEFGSKDDWVSKTLLKHALAAIIQAHWRGYWVRLRWKVNREQLVLDERARIEEEASHQARLQELQHKLALYQQKKLAQAAAEAEASGDGDPGARPALAANAGAAGAGVLPPGAGAGAGVSGVSRAASAAWRKAGAQLSAVASLRSLKSAGEASYQAEAQAGAWPNDSDSGWSNIELDDVAAIKFRAVTPPWQRGAERQQMSLALQQRTAAAAAATMGLQPSEFQAAAVAANWDEGLGGLGSCWEDEADDTTAKLQELRHRRICRKPEPVHLSAPAVAAAATAGLLAAPQAADDDAAGPSASAAAAGDDDGAGEAGMAAAAGALPQHVVEALLLERYREKYARLGLPHKMPGRRRWAKMQTAAAAAAAAADGGAEGGGLPEVEGPGSAVPPGGQDSAGVTAGGQAGGLDEGAGVGPATQPAQ